MAMQRLVAWSAAGALALYLLNSLVRTLFFGARNIMSGGPNYFISGASLIAFAGFQCGVIVAVGLTTATFRNGGLLWLRCAVLTAYLFVILDFLVSMTVP